MEEWKDVKGYEGYYEVSNLGRVRSLDRVIDLVNPLTGGEIKRKGKLLKQRELFGYMLVNLCVHDRRKNTRVHRMVTEAFLDNPDNKPYVNHKNGIKSDNRLYNLEWVTGSENNIHAFKTGLATACNKKKIMCVENQKVFESSYKAAEWLNNEKFGNTKKIKVMADKFRTVASGKRKIAYGYQWKYIN
jgi:hypothetical protein